MHDGSGPGKLLAYPARLAAFQRGPIVGAVQDGAVGITCQTNVPAEVTQVLAPVPVLVAPITAWLSTSTVGRPATKRLLEI